jgi:hypothetical protein
MQLSMSDGADHNRGRTWTADEVARERRATDSRLARARARGPEANVMESAALARFANKVAAAAAAARRHDDP